MGHQQINLDLVRYWLNQKDKTQAELAEYLGISTNTMVSIFKQGICRTDQLQKMAEFVNRELWDFITSAGEPLREDYIQQMEELDRVLGHVQTLQEHNKHLEKTIKVQDRLIEVLEEKLEKYEPKKD